MKQNTPHCACGETDPTKFSPSTPRKCKACVSAYAKEYHRKKREQDPDWHRKGITSKGQALKDKIRELHPDYIFPKGCRGAFKAPVIAGKKICRECLNEWPVEFYHLDSKGHPVGVCKSCLSKREEQKRRKKGARTHTLIREELQALYDRGTHICPVCGVERPFPDGFHKKSESWAGYNLFKCKVCVREYLNQRVAEGHVYQKYDPILQGLRARLYGAVKNQGVYKDWENGPSDRLFGCSRAQLVQRFEDLWWSGMSWANHGNAKGIIAQWHMDHIIPPREFDLTQEIERRAWCNWRNLQPLWRALNMSKKHQLDWTLEGKELVFEQDGVTVISRPPPAAFSAMQVTKPELLAAVRSFDDENNHRGIEGHSKALVAVA